MALLAFPTRTKAAWKFCAKRLPGREAAIAVLANPTMAEALPYTKDVPAVARLGASNSDFERQQRSRNSNRTFAVMKQQGVGALLVMADPNFNVQRELIISLAARHSIPGDLRMETVPPNWAD